VIPFTRAQARDFGALLAKCATGRPRGPGPPLSVRVRDGVRTIDAVLPSGVRLTHTTPTPGAPDTRFLFPFEVLTAGAGADDEPVVLEPQSKSRATAHWSDAEGRRVLPVELLLPGKQHDLPDLPALAPVKAELLVALHECGRTTARDDGRFALSHVQVRGSTGTVIGTDGRTALLWSGFDLSFADDVLVPALTVFGAKPLASTTPVRVGRAPEHCVVSAGPWAVWLPSDTKAKYPDVPAVVPRRTPTTIELDPRDADALAAVLPDLPGSDHESRPVTLDVASALRVRAASDGTVKSLALARSAARGSAVQIALDRRAILRALALWCRTVRLGAPDKPATFTTADRTFVVAALSADLVVPDTAEPAPTPTHKPERSFPVKPDPAAPARGDPPNAPDPLDLAESLRVALAEAAATAAKLVAALRHSKREKKALATVLTGLKQLNLGGAP
jgi:hypothetical protein